MAASCLALPASAQVEVELWTLSANLRESYTDNLFFTSVAEQGELVSAATLSLSYNRLRRASSLGAFGWVNGQVFGRLDGYNQAQFGLGLSGRKGLDRRLGWRYSGYYGDGINFDALLGGGRALPQLDVKSGTFTTGTTFALTPRTSWDVSLEGTYLRYRARIPIDTASLPFDPQAPIDVIGATRPQPIDPAALVPPDGTEILRLLSSESLLTQSVDYWSWRLGTGVSHAFSPKIKTTLGFGSRFARQSPRTFRGGDQFDTSLGFARALSTTANLTGSYAFQSSSYGLTSRTHSLSLGGDKEFSDRWRGDLTLGATYFDGSTPESSGWTWIGGLGTSLKFDRSSLTGRYARTVYQGQIVPSLQITDVFSLGGGHAFTKRVFGSLFGYYHSARDQSDRRFSYESGFLSTGLSVRLSKRINVGLNYAFQYFDGRTFRPSSRSYFTLFFGYGKSWK